MGLGVELVRKKEILGGGQNQADTKMINNLVLLRPLEEYVPPKSFAQSSQG